VLLVELLPSALCDVEARGTPADVAFRRLEPLQHRDVGSFEQRAHRGVLEQAGHGDVEGAVGEAFGEQTHCVFAGARACPGRNRFRARALARIAESVHAQARGDAHLDEAFFDRVLDDLGLQIAADHEGRAELRGGLVGRTGLLEDAVGLRVARTHGLEAHRLETLGECIGQYRRCARAFPVATLDFDGDEHAQWLRACIPPMDRAASAERERTQHHEERPRGLLARQERDRLGFIGVEPRLGRTGLPDGRVLGRVALEVAFFGAHSLGAPVAWVGARTQRMPTSARWPRSSS
jgi:hypothetical protein